MDFFLFHCMTEFFIKNNYLISNIISSPMPAPVSRLSTFHTRGLRMFRSWSYLQYHRINPSDAFLSI